MANRRKLRRSTSLNNEDKKSSKARKSVSSKDSKAKKILSKPIRKTKIPQTKLSKAEALKQDEIAPIKIKEVKVSYRPTGISVSLNPIPEEPIPKHDILLAYKPEEILVTFKPKENNSRASDHSTSEEEIQTKTIVKPVIKKISHNKLIIFQNKPEKKTANEKAESHETPSSAEPESLSTML